VRGLHYVFTQKPARQPVQQFRVLGFEARSLARSEDQDGKVLH
jgi:hypothetical protein